MTTTTAPTTALCPSCAHNGPIAPPSCQLCAGVGTITLGPAALAERSPGTVSAAITCALALASEDEDTPLADRIRDLHDGGLLGNSGQGQPLADEDGTRLGLLYAADDYARTGDLGRVARLVSAGLDELGKPATRSR